MDIKEILRVIGENFSGLMTKLLKFLSELGINMNNTQGKILNLLIVIGLALAIIKIVERPIKWVFVILLILLAISIGVSFVQ